MASQEEQEKLLKEALASIKQQAFQMKLALDQNKLMEGLRHCSNLLGELRTSTLSPKYYYSLYMSIFDELRHLTQFLKDEHQRGQKLADLYELVQYAGFIVPRLYLMVTVGGVYIETKEPATREILLDMLDMCRGVQHPTRGLFLRNYLSQITKDKLPDVSSSSEHGTTQDSINFVLTNFIEMNKLWVRLQHQGPMKEREKREKERKELRILVGTNLVRLSQLDGVDLDTYRKTVLPAILEEVVSCQDVIAQEYLMEVIIQVFHDDLHLHTLEEYLDAVSKLEYGVPVKNLLIALMDRLASYATRPDANGDTPRDENDEPISRIPTDIPLFDILFAKIKAIVSDRVDLVSRVETLMNQGSGFRNGYTEQDYRQFQMNIESIIAVLISLLNLALVVYPNRKDYVDAVFGYAKEILTLTKSKNVDSIDPAAGKLILKLLKIPIDAYNDIITILSLDNFSGPISFLSYRTRRLVAIAVANNTIANTTLISEPEQANRLLTELLAPLMEDQSDGSPAPKQSYEPNAPSLDEEYVEDQNLVARLIHLFFNESADAQYRLLSAIAAIFGKGGYRIQFTFPPLTIAALKLALRFRNLQEEDDMWEKKCLKVFQFSHKIVSEVAKHEHFEIAMRLFLQCAQSADKCGFETVAYEFVTQAMQIYEEQVNDSKAQFSAIQLLIGTIQTMRVFSPENYDTLVTKCAMHSSKLLKKPDQCRGVYLCSHLFWATPLNGATEEADLYRDGKRVLECLQKSLKIADSTMDATLGLGLFVEILNRYLYFYERKNQSVSVKTLNGLISLILEKLKIAEGNDEVAPLARHLRNTLAHLQHRQQNPEEGSPSYDEIEVAEAIAALK